jgi:hypothetical protein
MSAIVEIRERIQGTIALIAEYERAALRPGAPASLSVNIRSLEKLKAQLEEDFQEIATNEEMDICRYRLLIDQERAGFGSITKAWNQFQLLFSSLYDAVKNGPKKKGRISKHDLAATQFGFAFTFAGSIGVVLTLPTDRDADADYLDRAAEVLFEMARAGTVEEVAGFVERFGVPPIIQLNRWVKAHVEFRSGAAVEWRKRESTSNLLVQFPELKRLQDAIATISEPKVEEQVMPGLLVGANTSKRTFQMRLDTGEEISGAFVDAISQEHKVELPKHYQAVIRKTTQIKEATEQEEISYFLVRLGRPLRP